MTAINTTLLRTLCFGLIGAAILGLAGVPGGWIAGAMLGVAIPALSGIAVAMPDWLRDFAFVCVGISMGTGVTPQTLALLPSWPVTLLMVVASIPVIAGTLALFLMRVAKWDGPTALLASMPGALSYLIAVAPEVGAHVPRVAIVQTVRVAILVAVIPFVAIVLAEDVASTPTPPQASLDELLLLGAGGIGGAVLAQLLKVPAGLMIGALGASAALYGSGLLVGHPPQLFAIFGFVIMGSSIGARFSETRWRDLNAVLWTSIASFAIGGSLAVVIAILGSWITGLPLLKLIVAFAPGGLEAMVVLAFAMQLDPAFVAAHHLVRFLLIVFILPFVLGRVGVARATDRREG
ncbi:MAG: AbrB family transcriptional regulator [Pseudomonadota bacterium]